jgi:hypothetical protein
MSLNQAMEAMESVSPDHVFLVKGAECCICLDAFGVAAEQVVTVGGGGQHVSAMLRRLDPPITALRCMLLLTSACSTCRLHTPLQMRTRDTQKLRAAGAREQRTVLLYA